MKRIALALGLLLSLTGLLAVHASATGSSPASANRLTGLEQRVLTKLNTVRATEGLRPLVVSSGLEKAAVAHSRSMLDGGFFEHDSKDGSSFSVRLKRYYAAAGYERWAVGENLLYTTGETNAAQVIRAWSDSPSHRRNMLSSSWTEVGVGALRAGSPGGTFEGKPTLVITIDFGSRSGGKAPEPVAAVETPAKNVVGLPR